MPAASIDAGLWQLESADILGNVGFEPITREQMHLVLGAWQGVMHRTDSAALFWTGFSLAGDRNPLIARRIAHNFCRSFMTMYFFLLIRIRILFAGYSNPENFGDQFIPFEEMLKTSSKPYLSGSEPNTLDFLLFGVIQCHSSIFVPPVTALQSDPRLGNLRNWISAMQNRLTDYDHLYSGMYFAPYTGPPGPASTLDQMAFWLGSIFMVALFPITVPLVALLAFRVSRS